MKTIEEIEKICEIRDDLKTLADFSVDASIFKVIPKKVAFPKNTDELKKLVKFVSENTSDLDLSLSPRAAGTCMSGGSLTESIMVDMKEGFRNIGEIDTEKKQIWVGAGAYYRDLEKKTLEKGLLFPPYTSSKDLCCVGGMVGNNASGEKSLRYGATIQSVLALKMICSDGEEYFFGEVNEDELDKKKSEDNFEGEVYRKLSELILANLDLIESSKPKVKKNAAGLGVWNVYNSEKKTWNIAKLIVGSQGTLGFVTEILLQLVPNPKNQTMLVLPIQNLERLAEAVKEILDHGPEGLETYDSHTFELAKKYLPQEAALAKRSDGANLVLFAQFSEETLEETNSRAHKCLEDLGAKGFSGSLIESNEEREAHWTIRRMSYKLLKDHAPTGFIAAPFIEDTIVPIDRYGEFLSSWEKILDTYNMTYTFAGHIGDGSIRLIPLSDCSKSNSVEQIFSLADESYKLVTKYGGSISVDHNDGLIRTPYLSLMFSQEMLHVFEQTKKIFDPENIFNPGKKVFGSLQFAKTHTKLLETKSSNFSWLKFWKMFKVG